MDSTPPKGPPFVLSRGGDVEVGIPGRGAPADAPAAEARDVPISLADRRPTHDVTLSLYGAQRALVKARIALRTLLRTAGTRDETRRDAIWHSASFTARLTRLQADADRVLITAARLIDGIEGSSDLPSPEERRQAAIAVDEARNVVGELNALMQYQPATTAIEPVSPPPA